jgi:DNA repair protein REV1
MLKVMRRAASAPLDPPKHLGHGECDTFNKSVQLGLATNNPEILGRETIAMMRSLKIPPGELRGIGLQMGKLEKAGEALGQKKLDFSKMTGTETTQGSPKVKAQKPAIMPQTPVQSSKLTDVDRELVVGLPEDRSSNIFPGKTMEIRASQIDQDVFNELPPSIQQEIQQATTKTFVKVTPKRKKPSPKKNKSGQGMIGQSKLPMVSAEDLDTAVLAELPSTIRQEAISDAKREHAIAQAAKARHLAWAAEKAVRERKVNRTISLPDPPPKPTFQKVSELPELRNLISMWFQECRDEGPADEDVKLLGNYLQKVVLIEKDLRKAGAVVSWFLWCCRETNLAKEEWWDAGQRLGEYVNDACTERGVGKINFDT